MKSLRLRLIRSLLFRGADFIQANPEAFAKMGQLFALDMAEALNNAMAQEANERAELYQLQQRVEKIEKGRAS